MPAPYWPATAIAQSGSLTHWSYTRTSSIFTSALLPGTQRRVLTPGKNQKHYIAGALRAKSRRLVWAEGLSKNSTLFCKLLWKLGLMHRRARKVHLIIDNNPQQQGHAQGAR